MESTQLLTTGAARSQPSLEGERGRLTALVFLSSEDDSSATVLSFGTVGNSELLLSCGVVQQLGNCVGMWMGKSWESCSRVSVLRGEHLPPQIITTSLPAALLGWAELCRPLFDPQPRERACSKLHKASRHQARFYNKMVQREFVFALLPISQGLSCPAKPLCLFAWEGFRAPPHTKRFSNFPVSPVSHNVNGQKNKTQNHGREGKPKNGVIPC